MKRERCPHCGELGFFTARLPKEVVAVMACHHCHELSVFFRKKIIPIDRKIIESGSFDERKAHLADVIAQFLEAGLFKFDNPESFETQDSDEGEHDETPKAPRKKKAQMPITDQEVDRFVRIDLKCIDNPTYFKRIFG